MNFENIFTPYNARKLTEADVPDILGLYLENNAKKISAPKSRPLKKARGDSADELHSQM